jgi:PAS domain S-box-containing protein
MKRPTVTSQPEAAQPGPGGTTHGDLSAEFAGMARLARGIARTRFASISITGVGETWCGSDGPRSAAHGRAEWPLRNGADEVLGTLAVHDTTTLHLTEEQQTLLAELARQCAVSAELLARIAELELLHRKEALKRPSPAAGPSPLSAAPTYEVLDSAPVALYYVDAARGIDYCNAEYRRIFGLRADQRPNEWAQGVHPEDLDAVQAEWAKYCARPQSMAFEYRSRPQGGAVRVYAEHVQPLPGNAYIGTISDFTDLVTARGELHKIENLFRNTFDQAPIGVAFANPQARFLRFNEAFCTLLGYAAEELSGFSMQDLTHPADRAESAKSLERLWAGDVPFLDFEKRYRRKDGTFIWVRTTTALVRDGERTDSSVEYLRDITHRRQLTAQLQQQRTLLEAVISDLPVGLLACDVSGKITHFNRAAAELHGMRLDEFGSSNSASLAADMYLMDGVTRVAEDDRPLARALRGETISELELTVVPREAPPRTTLSSARRLLGPEGQPLGAVAVIQDTTERKAQEMELERVHKELVTASREAGMAEVATNVLHNVGNILNSVNISASLVAERLRQSKAAGVSRLAALLVEQGDRVGQFIAEDARGKRVPEYMAALGEQLAADQRTALEELALLRENLEHIKDTVNMQQSYAKLCGVTETVEVVDLVEDSLRLNAGAFARHGVTLHREFGEVPRINVDKHKVLQILVNLVRNAKYACDDSGRSDKLISLRIAPVPAGVSIMVQDNGIGIPPQNMSRLFQHGFTTRAAGHGFGLHSGALAAQELGGTLRAESEGEGRGACFTLELPLSPPTTRR